MSALSTSPTREAPSPAASTARLTTSMTSSHSPSTLVNIASVEFGKPDSRTTRTASATASLTPASSPGADGVILKATIIATRLPRGAAGRAGNLDRDEPTAAVRPDRPCGHPVAGADRTVGNDGGRYRDHAGTADHPVSRRQRTQTTRPDLRPLRSVGVVEFLHARQPPHAGDGGTPAATSDQRDQYRGPAGKGRPGEAAATPHRPPHHARGNHR